MGSPQGTENVYSTTQAAELIGLTVRRIDQWTRDWGIVRPSDGDPTPGSGTSRQWSDADLRVLRVLRRLSDLRATRPALSAAAKVLRRDPPRVRDARWLIVTERTARVCGLRDLPGAGDGWIVRLGE